MICSILAYSTPRKLNYSPTVPSFKCLVQFNNQLFASVNIEIPLLDIIYLTKKICTCVFIDIFPRLHQKR